MSVIGIGLEKYSDPANNVWSVVGVYPVKYSPANGTYDFKITNENKSSGKPALDPNSRYRINAYAKGYGIPVAPYLGVKKVALCSGEKVTLETNNEKCILTPPGNIKFNITVY